MLSAVFVMAFLNCFASNDVKYLSLEKFDLFGSSDECYKLVKEFYGDASSPDAHEFYHQCRNSTLLPDLTIDVPAPRDSKI